MKNSFTHIKKIRFGLLAMILLFGIQRSFAQSVDVENLLKAKPLQVSGGFNANGVFSSGLPNNNSPFDYFLSGRLNFNVFGVINVPLSFNYSSRKISFSQGYSFNQLSIAPSYKWATAYIGTNYMTFSPYSLNGHQFVGAGVELSPNKWKIKAMYGRLVKSQYEDTLVTGPTYRRMGLGYQVQYNPGTYTVGMTMFKGYDEVGSVPELKRYYKGNVINPKDNLVVGLTFGTTLFHKLQLNVEYSNSVITKDQSPNYEKVSVRSLAGLFHNGNATTESYNAFKAMLNYNIAQTSTIVGVGYERVDPNYTTLGGYYFINDIVNYTFNIVQPLFTNKLNINANVGIQQDDLKRTKANRQSRFIGAISANLNVSKDLTMGFNFSNFQSYRFLNDTYSKLVRVPGLPIDTLNFSLVSQTYGYNLNKVLSQTDTKQSSINFNANYLVSRNIVADKIDTQSKTNIINTNINYALNYPQSQLGINAGLSYFGNMLYVGTLQGFGPTFGVQKTFMKKINTNLNLALMSVNNKMLDPTQSSSSSVFNASVSANYSPGKGHNLTFNTSLVKNQTANFLNGNIGYSYSF
jgi:hypothetical protein